MAGASHRRKGNRKERELSKRLDKLPGVRCRRQPLSGALQDWPHDLQMDVSGFGPLNLEVKARKAGAGFAQLDRWRGQADVLVLWRDRAEPCYYISSDIFEGLLRALAEAIEPE